MRGYGSWTIGWREGGRLPPSEPSGCGTILLFSFFAILVISFFRVGIETGNPMGFLLGLAVVAGVIKGMR